MFVMSRREWAGSMLAATITAAPQNPKTYAIVGAGVFGSWTAYHLLSAGNKVILIDQYGPASSRASSGGESRIIRCAYGPDQVYTRMAKRSLVLWSEFFAENKLNLLHRIGVLWMAKADDIYAQQSRETLRKVGVHFDDLSASELVRRYPQIHPEPGAVAILEPESGALMARQAVHAVVRRLTAQGGVYQQTAIVAPH